MSARCNVCRHPLIDQITALLKQQDEDKNAGRKAITAEAIMAIINEEAIRLGYDPKDLPAIHGPNLTRHRQNHTISSTKPTASLIVDSKGRVFKPDGTPVIQGTVSDFLKLVMSLSFQAIIDQKVVVQPKDGLAAAKLYAEINRDAIELDDFSREWVEFREKKAKERKAKKIADTLPIDPQAALPVGEDYSAWQE